MKRYYVGFYDMFDGWGIYGFWKERLFDDLEKAIKCCIKLQDELDDDNKNCGEYFGVIDGDTKGEVYCGKAFEGTDLDEKRLQYLITRIKERIVRGNR